MTKNCRECKIDKPLDQYFKVSKNQPTLRGECKDCKNLYAKNLRKTYSQEKLNNLKEKQKIHYNKNKDIILQKGKEYIKSNPNVSKRAELKHRFGITLETFVQMVQEHNNLCAICEEPEIGKHQKGTPRDLSVDHCHSTGKIRGLLCQKCNKGLGYFKDDINFLLNAIEYLKNADQYNNHIQEIDKKNKEENNLLKENYNTYKPFLMEEGIIPQKVNKWKSQ